MRVVPSAQNLKIVGVRMVPAVLYGLQYVLHEAVTPHLPQSVTRTTVVQHKTDHSDTATALRYAEYCRVCTKD